MTDIKVVKMHDLYELYKYLQKYTLVKVQYVALVSLSLTYWIDGLYSDWVIEDSDSSITRWAVIQGLESKGII
jgi:hypothetical protein